jgi:hypothetical protein
MRIADVDMAAVANHAFVLKSYIHAAILTTSGLLCHCQVVETC